MKRRSIKEVRNTLKKVYHWYKKNWKKLNPEELQELESSMSILSDEVLEKKKNFSENEYLHLKGFSRKRMKKSPFKGLRELVGAIIFAIIVATVIRQMWFELYEIPTGSMRPTFQEKDRLIVSKTDYAINVPITPKHFYFDNDLVNRGGIITFTAEDMDIHDPDQMYFYIFPGKKRLIKRCIGKPGDTLYFYGGKIYGFDQQGKEISIQEASYYPELVHIPYINFIGKVRASQPNLLGEFKEISFSQMNTPLGKIEASSPGIYQGKIRVNNEWIDDLGPLSSKEEGIHSYGDFWGINNYAMCRIITKKEIQSSYGFNPTRDYGDAEYYLELKHTPSLYTPLLKSHWKRASREYPMLSTLFTFIPMNDAQMKVLFSNMYTSRFVVGNQHAKRYSIYNYDRANSDLPFMKGVPDGTFEYENGLAYQVGMGGTREQVSTNSPLMKFSSELTQTLFNTGIDFLKIYEPETLSLAFPQRYAYYKEGDLYVMGRLFLKKDDESLTAFISKEEERQTQSTKQHPYRAFIDEGAPLLEDGSLDMNKVKTFGIKVPEKSYLVLGDNYASSGDSRDFGFVPQNNMRGGASVIIWPFNKRWGAPAQVPYKWVTTSSVIIWALAAIIIGGTIYYQRKQHDKPIYKKLSD